MPPQLRTERIAGWSSRWLTDELSSLTRSGSWDAAIETFLSVAGSAQGSGSPMVTTNVFHYTTLISGCARSGQWRPALNCFAHMRQRGIEPNVKTFTSVMHACGTAGRADLASRAYALLLSSNVHPNVQVTTAMVTALARSGQWDKAISVVMDSEDDIACNPNVFTYTAAMDGCRRARQAGPALALLERMSNRMVEPNAVTFNTAIAACAASSDWHGAATVYSQMRSRGLRPTQYTENNLTEAFRGTHLEGQSAMLVRSARASPIATIVDDHNDKSAQLGDHDAEEGSPEAF